MCKEINQDTKMSVRVRIKDIAQMAGVSTGTVDRIIHKRGKVSAESQELVKLALTKLNYKPNIHMSAISTMKRYKVIVAIPACARGEYWEQLSGGVTAALRKFNMVDLDCQFYHYDQFNLYSCIDVFESVVEAEPDGVIIGATFSDVALKLSSALDAKSIPYIYVDSAVKGSNPIATCSTDQHACGYLVAKLIDSITPSDAEFALFKAKRIGNQGSTVTMERREGFMEYFNKTGKATVIHSVDFSVVNPDENVELIGDFFEENPKVKGAIVLSSRGHILADYFAKHGVDDMKLICVDLTESNYKEIDRGGIEFVISQRPSFQGFFAVEKLIEYLMYQEVSSEKTTIMPLDIITKENVELYKKTAEANSSSLF